MLPRGARYARREEWDEYYARSLGLNRRSTVMSPYVRYHNLPTAPQEKSEIPSNCRCVPREYWDEDYAQSLERERVSRRAPANRTPSPVGRTETTRPRPASRTTVTASRSANPIRRPAGVPTTRQSSLSIPIRLSATVTTDTPTTLPPPVLANIPRTEPTQAVDEATQNVLPAEEEANSKVKECSICIEDKSCRNFLQVTAECTHEPEACRECIQHWLGEAVKASRTSQLSCITEGCDKVFHHGDFRRLTTTVQVFEEYDRLAAREVLSANPNWRWCLEPHCKSGGEHDADPARPIFTCIDCGHRACATHNFTWHQHETCTEYELRTNPGAQEAASVDEIARVAKPCPG